jgi:hypothetical protein
MKLPLRLALVFALVPACAKTSPPTAAPADAAAPPTEPTPVAGVQPEEAPQTGEPQPEPPQPEADSKPKRPPTPWTADNVPPLTPEEREIFFGSAEDQEPEIRGGISRGMEDLHYTIGNEWTLFGFYEDIKDLGGGYMGVGTDQAYLLIGWQRPELAWLTDYDPKIQRVHHMYRALFLAADTPEEFIDFFKTENIDKTYAAIDEIYDGKDKTTAQQTYRRARKLINYRMQKQKRKFKQAGVPTYWNDQETLDYIKAMLREDRIRPMLVNLTEEAGMKGVRQAASELGVPLRVLYVSNAEEYWKEYDPKYRKNIADLHSDDKSLLLRTRLIWGINYDYVYIVQSIDNYRAWLADPQVVRVKQMYGGHPKIDAQKINIFRITQLPTDAGGVPDVSAP